MRMKFLQKLTVGLLGVSLLSASLEEEIKESLVSFSDFLQEQLDNCNEDLQAFQESLDQNAWDEILPQKGENSSVKIFQLKLNGHNRAVVVSPGEQVEMVVGYQSENDSPSQISIGTLTQDPKTTIVLQGGLEGGMEELYLKAPEEPGIYSVRYNVTPANAGSWLDENNNPPGFSYTIGYIVVK